VDGGEWLGEEEDEEVVEEEEEGGRWNTERRAPSRSSHTRAFPRRFVMQRRKAKKCPHPRQPRDTCVRE
jgi:hypothetical protein